MLYPSFANADMVMDSVIRICTYFGMLSKTLWTWHARLSSGTIFSMKKNQELQLLVLFYLADC